MSSGPRSLGVLALAPRPSGRALTVEQRHLLDAFVRQSALALDRAHLFEEAEAAGLRARVEEMRSSLLSAVSHDLRTPLSAITGAATTLRGEGGRLAPSERRELLSAICDEAERLERLVGNLLQMTRLESGAVQVRREWVPLEEIVGAALTRIERELAGRPVELALPSELPLVAVDPVLFEQVFVNLFENAAKYTPPASPLAVRAETADGNTLLVTVADRGPGLAPGTEERIFEKLYRGPHVGVRGAGLGLSIVRAIVEAHAGSVKAANRRGGGAEFRIVVPIGGTPPALPVEAAGGTP